MLPLTVLAGAATLDEGIERARRWASAVWGRRVGSSTILAVGCALLVALFEELPPLPPPSQLLRAWENDVRALAPTLGGETVASARPWSVIANTESPAVMIPGNGADAMEDALKFYRARWLLLSSEPCVGASA